MTFDEIRATNPELGLALYALDDTGQVTLEVITPDGGLFTWSAATAEAALALAFPPDDLGPTEDVPPAPAVDIFA